jgi:hypothetical protein
MLVDKLGDIKEMILEQVKDFVVTRIITAGITWLISLLNPAAAFIKACKLIYDIIMFFVNNASKILAFVNTVIDSVADMVRGNVGAVIDKVDDALGKMVPILIGFLADLVGLGGIGQKVREIVQKLQKPINKAVDLVIGTGLKLAGPIIRGITGISSRVKAKVAAGKAWAKGKVDAVRTGVAGSTPRAPGDARYDVADARQTLIKHLGVRRPVPMKGRTHHVFAVVAGNRTTFMIASTPQAALGRLDIALAHPGVKSDAQAVGLLKGCRDELVRLQDEMDTALARSSQPEIAAAEANLTDHVKNVVSVLNTVGQAFDIVELRGTQWTTPDNEIRPELRESGRLRAVFYGSGYKRHTGALLSKAHDRKRELTSDLQTRFPALFARQSFYCPGVPGRIPPHLALDAEGVQADHRRPVAWHWNEIGRKSKHSVRTTWDTDIENLQALCPRCNQVKGSEGQHFNPKVERGFDGPD